MNVWIRVSQLYRNVRRQISSTWGQCRFEISFMWHWKKWIRFMWLCVGCRWLFRARKRFCTSAPELNHLHLLLCLCLHLDHCDSLLLHMYYLGNGYQTVEPWVEFLPFCICKTLNHMSEMITWSLESLVLIQFVIIELLPHSYRAPSSSLSVDYWLCGVPCVLPVSVWLSSGFSGFPTPPKNMPVFLATLAKINCP